MDKKNNLLKKCLVIIRERRLPWQVTKRWDLFKKRANSFIKFGVFDMFDHVYIDTITACNRSCYYCPNSKYDRGKIANLKTMDTQLFYKIIDELKEVGWQGEIVPNFYGEPLMDQRLPDLISYAREKLPKAKIILYTNGDFLTVPLYKRLVQAGVNVIGVTSHPPVEPVNIYDVLSYHKSLANDKVNLFYNKLANIYNRGGVNLSSRLDDKDCYNVALRKIGISWDGQIVFCCNDYFVSGNLGNVKDTKLIDIWNTEKYKELRRGIKKGQYVLEVCKRCFYGTP